MVVLFPVYGRKGKVYRFVVRFRRQYYGCFDDSLSSCACGSFLLTELPTVLSFIIGRRPEFGKCSGDNLRLVYYFCHHGEMSSFTYSKGV